MHRLSRKFHGLSLFFKIITSINCTNLLFLLPGPIYRPNLADFRDKYIMLSNKLQGIILACFGNKEFDNLKIGNFTLSIVHSEKDACPQKAQLAFLMLARAIKLNRSNKCFDAIVCYDPLFTGVLGAVLKYILRCKLVIEINGVILNAGFLEGYPSKRK